MKKKKESGARWKENLRTECRDKKLKRQQESSYHIANMQSLLLIVADETRRWGEKLLSSPYLNNLQQQFLHKTNILNNLRAQFLYKTKHSPPTTIPNGFQYHTAKPQYVCNKIIVRKTLPVTSQKSKNCTQNSHIKTPAKICGHRMLKHLYLLKQVFTWLMDFSEIVCKQNAAQLYII